MDKMSFHSDGFEGFRRRGLERAMRVDSNKSLPSVSAISFESPVELARILSPRRVLLLQSLAASGAQPLETLAQTLGREPDAVKRDLTLLRRIGAVYMTRRSKDGITRLWVRPAARQFEFTSSIGGSVAETSQTEYAAAS